MKNNRPIRTKEIQDFQRTNPATAMQPYYQQHISLSKTAHGATINFDDYANVLSENKYPIVTITALLLLAALAGCTTVNETRNYEKNVKVGEINIPSTNSTAELYVRCGANDICVIYKGEISCSPGGLGVNYADKPFYDDFCYNYEPKDLVLKKLSTSF